MIERPESQHFNLTPENQHLDNVVQLFKSAQYVYDGHATHNDPEGSLHFSKPITGRLFSHLHLTYIPEQNRFNLHLDIRKHVATIISTHVSQGVEDLHRALTSQVKSGDCDKERLRLSLIKQCLEMALFRTASIRNSLMENNGFVPMGLRQTEVKRRRLKKATKHALQRRKFKLIDANEAWLIEDREPLPLDFGKTDKVRQEDELVVKI